jgi:Do/DeqQ family serine protease
MFSALSLTASGAIIIIRLESRVMLPRIRDVVLMIAAVALCIAIAIAAFGRWVRGPAAETPPAPLPVAESLQSAFISVAEKVRPAVVNIGTVQVARDRRTPLPSPFADNPAFKDFFDQFFGRGGPSPREEFRQPSLGSGVIIDKRGDILTNFHVVKGADSVTVRLSSKREYRGRIVGTDPKTDLAVIRFQPEGEIAIATLGNSDALQVGEWAIAIGNPFGLDQTVTVGVISATGRSDVGIATYENFIQTDASINPGNSGGPLVNLKSEVVGINTAIVAAGQGIGFAIPVNMVKRVVGQLVERGKVTRGWVGIALEPLTEELAQSLGVPKAGAVVGRVYPDGPAASAGLTQSDVIVSYDGTPVEDYRHFQRLVADTEVGKRVKIEIIRRRAKQTVILQVAEAPDAASAAR